MMPESVAPEGLTLLNSVMPRKTKLSVLNEAPAEAWYAEGLKFTCAQCGNCCSGPPGYVWMSDDELQRLSQYLNMPLAEVKERYCRTIGGRTSLREVRNTAGQYDCIFLESKKVTDRQGISAVQRGCTIYPVRPLQCRTWPFWDGNLSDAKIWDRAAKRCHGMNHGRKFTAEEMEALRDATDWPENPPTSKSGNK
jgi:hypothetical protein